MRPPKGDHSMTHPERRQRSDADKKARGEKRVNTWITSDATQALGKLVKGGAGSSEREVISAALVQYAETFKKHSKTTQEKKP